jgi:hypothetical protein
MWRSSERHSLYQVMLAAGHEEGLFLQQKTDPETE